jgi:hypothetical protein
MKHKVDLFRRLAAAGAMLIVVAFTAGCGKDGMPMDENLLKNSSFEDVEGNVPVGWKVEPFRGLEGMRESEYGIDTDHPFDGENAFFFKTDAVTRRFLSLTQEIEVRNVDRIKLRGAVRTLDVRREREQYSQANLALTFYDKDRNRFYSSRFYDKRTKPRLETTDDWIVEELIVRVPVNTAYVVVHCALGMSGTMWYDDVTLEIPTDIGWNTSESENFTFHWMTGSEYPDESREYQQQLFDSYATRLGIPKEERPKILYFFYPDSISLYEAIGSRAPKKSFWDSREVHSTFPVDDHEIIHILTNPYGILPFGLTEGTAFYLIGTYKDKPVQLLAHDQLMNDKLPAIRSIIEPFSMRQMDPDLVIPAAATFVGFLVEFGGPERFLEFHAAANNKRSFEEFAQGFEDVYERTLGEAEAAWRTLLGSMEFPDSTQAGQQQ